MNDAMLMVTFLYYVALGCTRDGQSHPAVSLCPLLLSTHWAWPRATALLVEFGELVYSVYTQGEPTRVP